VNEIQAGRVIDTENETREDDHPYKAGEFSEDLLKEAPFVDKGCIRVKHILG
jgi:Asp-tRNA(Asn)/Glu-tRNA(Gln) amidotransferase C subunit